MARRRRGRKGPSRMDPKLEWIVYPLIITIVLALPIWAFSPFDQGLHISWMIGASITLFGLYGYDKGQAKSGGKRIPEVNLHLMSFLGGFLGGLAGMYFFRHKTRKFRFLIVIAASALLHGILLIIFL
jgi:uncharacterized membrane protein YsdA (DUF1294 family)